MSRRRPESRRRESQGTRENSLRVGKGKPAWGKNLRRQTIHEKNRGKTQAGWTDEKWSELSFEARILTALITGEMTERPIRRKRNLPPGNGNSTFPL